MKTDNTPVPDYGEPWKANEHEPAIEDRAENAVLGGIDYFFDFPKLERATVCTNACAGMADPADEIAAMREELAALRRWKSEQLAVEAGWDCQKVGKLLNLPLDASIRPAIQPAIEAMQEAINEATVALTYWRRSGFGMSTDFTLQSQAFRKSQSALARLRPFLPCPAPEPAA